MPQREHPARLGRVCEAGADDGSVAEEVSDAFGGGCAGGRVGLVVAFVEQECDGSLLAGLLIPGGQLAVEHALELFDRYTAVGECLLQQR